jgi:hypothetical protein
MDSYTVSQVYHNDIDENKDYGVYVYYDPDNIPLYIGRSRDVVTRLQCHLGETSLGNLSLLGITIKRNLPDSSDWRVDLYNPGDYGDSSDSSRKFEEDLIWNWRPVLNATGNRFPHQKSRFWPDDEEPPLIYLPSNPRR